MVATRLIWSGTEPNNTITILLKVAWVVCFVIDLYTSFIGTRISSSTAWPAARRMCSGC